MAWDGVWDSGVVDVDKSLYLSDLQTESAWSLDCL